MTETPTYRLQVVVDAADPHALADWWATALGWQREPSDEEFIRSMIEQGYATESDTLVHAGELVWAQGAAIRHPAGLDAAPRLLFQRVPEAKSVKNRVHLDLRDGPAGADAVQRLVGLGATRIGEGSEGEHSWTVLADPEGNELCI